MKEKTNYTKRLNSATTYIDSLQDIHSKLNIVRVDLAYKKPYSDTMTLDDANDDLDRMFNNMRSKPTIFKDKIGHICKREYTEDKGVHFHALFIYDGQKIHKDAFIADKIGSYWNKTITKEKGSYYNCNRNDYKDSGIGMLDYKDDEKRKILDEKVISYLCKDEQDIEPIKTNKKDRSFTRGTIAKSKGNMGRPRKQGV